MVRVVGTDLRAEVQLRWPGEATAETLDLVDKTTRVIEVDTVAGVDLTAKSSQVELVHRLRTSTCHPAEQAIMWLLERIRGSCPGRRLRSRPARCPLRNPVSAL